MLAALVAPIVAVPQAPDAAAVTVASGEAVSEAAAPAASAPPADAQEIHESDGEGRSKKADTPPAPVPPREGGSCLEIDSDVEELPGEGRSKKNDKPPAPAPAGGGGSCLEIDSDVEAAAAKKKPPAPAPAGGGGSCFEIDGSDVKEPPVEGASKATEVAADSPPAPAQEINESDGEGRSKAAVATADTPPAPAPAGGGGSCMEIDESDVEEVPAESKWVFNFDEELRAEDPIEGGEVDSERTPRETVPFPTLHRPVEANPSAARAKALAKIQQEVEQDAAEALRLYDVGKAVDRYTEAMRMGGCTSDLLLTRAALLLKNNRPLAAIRDCSAALKIDPTVVKAMRIRGLAHRKLGNYVKAHRDLTKAQKEQFEQSTVDVHKFVADVLRKAGKLPGQQERAERRAEAQAAREAAARERAAAPTPAPMLFTMPAAVPAPAPVNKDLSKGQAVMVGGLKNAQHLNGVRGVIVGEDPRPASRGRWEVELRLAGGSLEVKSLKAENIVLLNKADRAACKAWKDAEKGHASERRQREERTEQEMYKKCVQGKLTKLGVGDRARELLLQLDSKKALDLLDKVDGSAGVTNVDQFLCNQARLASGADDSEDSDDDGGGKEGTDDPDLIPEETETFPPAPAAFDGEPSEEQQEASGRAMRSAAESLEQGESHAALEFYTEAMQAGGVTALMLVKRADLLLKLRRPCAALVDCTAAIKANPNCGKAYNVRGRVNRALARWEDAHRDLVMGQALDFDESLASLAKLVESKVEPAAKRPGDAMGAPPSKRAREA